MHGEEDDSEAAALAALVADRAFEDLDGPVRRVRADADVTAALRELAGF